MLTAYATIQLDPVSSAPPLNPPERLIAICSRYSEAKIYLQSCPDGKYRISRRVTRWSNGQIKTVETLKSDFTVKQGVLHYNYRDAPDDLEAIASGVRL